MKSKPLRQRDGSSRLAGRAAGRLTARQIKAITRAWEAGESQQEIARKAGLGVAFFKARLLDQLAHLARRPRRACSGRRVSDPTPEEIYGRLTMIEQQAWSDEEREDRWQGFP
jgi:hypothetical protein